MIFRFTLLQFLSMTELVKNIRVKFKTLDCKDLTFMLHSKKAYFLNIQSTNLLISYAV